MLDDTRTATNILKFLQENCDSWNVTNAPTNESAWKFDRNVTVSTLIPDGWVRQSLERRIVIDKEWEWIDNAALDKVADLGSLRYRVFVSKASKGGGLDTYDLFLAWVSSEDDTKPVFISLQPD